jgi:A/G-specific adenine glycosylase
MKPERKMHPQTHEDYVTRFRETLSRNRLTLSAIRSFQKIIYRHYRQHARTFPWRATHDPYHILVSEIMLQQTQTERVIEKYERFIQRFPDFASLAQAPLRAILRLWKGLGYNRRALALKKIAEIVTTRFHGTLPSRLEDLITLPGIGKASASAISAFAFNLPTAFIETNIRSVFIHVFFQNKNRIKDAEILPLVEKTLDASNPREWYYALMDYGAMLKKNHPDLGRRSAHYQKQTPFRNSNRQIRGMILKALVSHPNTSLSEIARRLNVTPQLIKNICTQLQKEGFIKKTGRRFTIA